MDSGPPDGMTFHHQVTAVNIVGEGPRGEEVHASTCDRIPGTGLCVPL